jgi:hypothetical protein
VEVEGVAKEVAVLKQLGMVVLEVVQPQMVVVKEKE